MIKKYVCINNHMYNYLTIGKIYNVKKLDITYIIYQDHLLPMQFDINSFNKLFISLSEWRNQQIDKILNTENLE
jgi:hypothetical protein